MSAMLKAEQTKNALESGNLTCVYLHVCIFFLGWHRPADQLTKEMTSVVAGSVGRCNCVCGGEARGSTYPSIHVVQAGIFEGERRSLGSPKTRLRMRFFAKSWRRLFSGGSLRGGGGIIHPSVSMSGVYIALCESAGNCMFVISPCFFFAFPPA